MIRPHSGLNWMWFVSELMFMVSLLSGLLDGPSGEYFMRMFYLHVDAPLMVQSSPHGGLSAFTFSIKIST